jgi:excisionase family DNA binding protein
MKAPATWETVQECAKRLSISTRLLRELMKNGTIPFHRAGRRVILDALEVDEAIYKTRRAA